MTERTHLTDEILLTIPQAAKLMHTDVGLTRKLVKNGHIKCLKLGELKIRRAEIDRFLKDAEGYDYKDPDNVRRLDNATL